jgi:hypothetical protein
MRDQIDELDTDSTVRLEKKFFLYAIVIFLLMVTLIPWLYTTLGGLPSAGPDDVSSVHAAQIYSNVNQPSPIITPENIKLVELPANEKLNTSTPFGQLASGSLALVVKVLFLVGLSATIISLIPRIARKRFMRETWEWRLTLSSWILLSGASLTALVMSIPMMIWDEAYVFASAARNFAESGVPGVLITGPKGVAESSVDLLVILVAGLIKIMFRVIEADTSLIISAILLSSVAALIVAVIARNKFGSSRAVSIGMAVILLLTPATISTLSGGMPTVIGTVAWPILGLTLYLALSTKSYTPLALTSVALLFVRWDMGTIAVVTCGVILAVQLLRRRKQQTNDDTLDAKFSWILLVPVAIFGAVTLIRFAFFGSLVPSGLLGKSVGIDGAYLQSGVSYFRETLLETLWLLVVLVTVAAAFIYLKSDSKRHYFLSLVVVSIPAIAYLPGGRDWFPTFWSRYTLPSVAAVLILSLALLSSSTWTRKATRKTWVGLVTILFAVQIPGTLGIVQGLNKDKSGVYRVECLAQAGQSLRQAFPDLTSVASPEVNTVAYYADAHLTDLIGIVDPRTASVPKSPLAPGDPIHRRANPDIIATDQPDAIYLYEGADCVTPNTSLEDEVTAWNELLGSDLSRFRAGNLNSLLVNYKPVTIRIPDRVAVRFLVKNDLVQNLP